MAPARLSQQDLDHLGEREAVGVAPGRQAVDKRAEVEARQLGEVVDGGLVGAIVVWRSGRATVPCQQVVGHGVGGQARAECLFEVGPDPGEWGVDERGDLLLEGMARGFIG